MEDREDTAEAIDGIGRLRLGAVLALAAAAVFVGWLLLKEDDKDCSTPQKAITVASVKELKAPKKTIAVASVKDLEELPVSVGHPVYWAGAREGFTYELTRTREGNIYIRYLPAGVEVNDKRPDFLTVGTYPYPRAIATARSQAKRPGAFKGSIAGHGIAYSLPTDEKSVYFAYPRLDYLYEVFDPTPLAARRLVLSGCVIPIG